MNALQIFSIGIELLIAILGILLLVRKRKPYGWKITLTFLIYVFYDLAHLYSFINSETLLSALFTVASLSALWAVLDIYKEKKVIFKKKTKTRR